MVSKEKFKHVISLICGILILLINFYGFVLLRLRAGIPPEINLNDLRQIENIKIEQTRDIEFILRQKKAGESLTFVIESDGKLEKIKAILVPFYAQAPLPLIYLIIGFCCLAIGFFVFILRSEESKARIFYWASLALSSALIINGGFYCLRKEAFSYLPGIVFNLFYPLAPALLLHFSLSFSERIGRASRFLIYIPAILFIGAIETTFLMSSLKSSIEIFRIYLFIYYVFRFYLLLYILLAVFHLIIRYRKALLDVTKAQIKWILYGFFVGLAPFLFLYQLPQVIKTKPVISEEFSILFFIFIPIAFAISIVKFKLMNIELLIHRSLVYGILTVFIVSLYLFSVYVFQNLLLKFIHVQKAAISALAALAAAAAFHPARRKIQEFVDKSFYRLSYDYRETILGFNEKAQRMINPDHLIDFFMIKIKKALPVEDIGLFICSEDSTRRRLIFRRGSESKLGSLAPVCLKREKVLARKGALRTEENVDFEEEGLLRENNIELIIPLSFRSSNLAGFIPLGRKMSGERFSRDDIELLMTMAGELALNIERIRLQEEVIYERAEKEKLDELSRLKTEFISTVSHELRTPMTSIHGLTEVLQEGKIKDKVKQDEILSLVASESSRLSRLLHNILDFGNIESQAKTYDFQKTELKPVIEGVVELFRYRLKEEGFTLRINLPQKPIVLRIDRDAISQALTNLIDNAIKYSLDKREIDIELFETKEHIKIRVKDKGIGIPPDEQDKIFDRFYRCPEASKLEPKGVGLGLKIIKHIMEAHQGEIRVESQPRKGSTFSLIFTKL